MIEAFWHFDEIWLFQVDSILAFDKVLSFCRNIINKILVRFITIKNKQKFYKYKTKLKLISSYKVYTIKSNTLKIFHKTINLKLVKFERQSRQT